MDARSRGGPDAVPALPSPALAFKRTKPGQCNRPVIAEALIDGRIRRLAGPLDRPTNFATHRIEIGGAEFQRETSILAKCLWPKWIEFPRRLA